VYVHETEIEERHRLEDSLAWSWMVSASSPSNPHRSQIGTKRKGERIGSGREDRYAVSRAKISGVDSRWREPFVIRNQIRRRFCTLKPFEWLMLPGSCFPRVENVDEFEETRG